MSLKEDFENHEKIERFDNMRKFAQELWEAKANDKRDDDEDHWCFETLMTNCLSTDDTKDFWQHYNNLGKGYDS